MSGTLEQEKAKYNRIEKWIGITFLLTLIMWAAIAVEANLETEGHACFAVQQGGRFVSTCPEQYSDVLDTFLFWSALIGLIVVAALGNSLSTVSKRIKDAEKALFLHKVTKEYDAGTAT